MDNKSLDKEEVVPNALPDSDLWTDAELIAYDQLEVDLYDRYRELTKGGRQWYGKLYRCIDKMFLPLPNRKPPNTR